MVHGTQLIPLFKMLKELSEAGKNTAHSFYGCRGFAVHHNTDLWRKTTPASGQARWALWPMAGVWFCSHLWQHFQYTQDFDFLQYRRSCTQIFHITNSRIRISAMRDIKLTLRIYSIQTIKTCPVQEDEERRCLKFRDFP